MQLNIFDIIEDDYKPSYKISNYVVKRVNVETAKEYICEHHYSKGCSNAPHPCYALYDNNKMIGCLMFATPCSENVRSSVFGKGYENNVTELHRLHILDVTPRNTESWFISKCLKLLLIDEPNIWAVISFSDTTEGHEGTIYKASNFIRCGKSGIDKVEEFNCCCVPYRKTNNLGYEHFIDNGVYKVEWKENINLRHSDKEYNNPQNYKDDGVVFERKDRYINTMFKNDDLEKSKLTPQELLDYIGLGNNGYALHLTNLKVLDNPKELFEYDVKPKAFKTIEGYSITNITYSCNNAPQNMCNVYDRVGNHYVLISIQPQHLCNILNGKKTIEVRRKVLNCLKEMCKDE